MTLAGFKLPFLLSVLSRPYACPVAVMPDFSSLGPTYVSSSNLATVDNSGGVVDAVL